MTITAGSISNKIEQLTVDANNNEGPLQADSKKTFIFSSSVAPLSSSSSTVETKRIQEDVVRNKEVSNVVLKSNYTLIFQKEYSFTTPKSDKPILGTTSVRGCYYISFFHPEVTFGVHWDDATKKSELKRIVKVLKETIEKLTQKTMVTKEIVCNIAGGNNNQPLSKKTGEYIKDTLQELGFSVTTHGYQEKKFIKSVPGFQVGHTFITTDMEKAKETGFSLVATDSRTGQILLWDDWTFRPPVECYGSNVPLREETREYLIRVHEPEEGCSNAGCLLIDKDNFLTCCEKEATALCLATQKNQKEKVISLIDNGIVYIDYSPKRALGWTALHYACKMENWDIAHLLIAHGASINVKNQKGNTPLDFVKNMSELCKLTLHFKGYRAGLEQHGKVGLVMYTIGFRHFDWLSKEHKKNGVGI